MMYHLLMEGAVVISVLAMVGFIACGPDYQCTGSAIQCQDFTPDFCSSVPGCAPGPSCIVYDTGNPSCPTHKTQATCVALKCQWTLEGCIDVCRTLTDSVSCYATHAPVGTSTATPDWGCLWVDCSGAPVKPFCSDYSTSACPADLGCSVERVYAF